MKFLQDVSDGDVPKTFQFLSFINRFDLGEKLLLDGIDAVSLNMPDMVRREYSRMLNKRNERRCRNIIPNSRLLYGVCDAFGKAGVSSKLRPGTCFLRVTDFSSGQTRTVVGTEVLVTRNPCLHPGDLQKFKAAEVPEFSHLVDCIGFPNDRATTQR